MGGKPFPDGDDHGRANEDFASVVFDEAFVQAAVFHEPSARERMLAAARTDTLRSGYEEPAELAEHEDGPEHDLGGEYDELYAQRVLRPYRGQTRWHRSVAWVLAVIMGIGVVALTFAAVYRSGGGGRQQPAPSSTTGRVGAPSPTTPPPVAASPTP